LNVKLVVHHVTSRLRSLISTVQPNPLKKKHKPIYLKTVNTFHLGYKNQSVYAVSDTSRWLFSDKHKTHKYSVGRAYSCWMLNW